MVNVGEQNKPHGAGGRSILDYSLIACFTLIILLAILVLDAFEYITVPGAKKVSSGVSAGVKALTGNGEVTNDELLEVQKQIEEAKKVLAEKQAEVEKVVDKVEEELEEEKKEEAVAKGEVVQVETPVEKLEKEVEKEKVVEAIVEKELNLDRWCGGCRYGSMNFTCAKRVDWLVSAYGMSQDQAKESTMNKCGRRRLRGIHEFNFEDNNDVEAGGKGIDW